MYLYAILSTNVFKTFHYSFCIGYNYLSYFGFGTLPRCSFTCVLIAVSLCMVVVVIPCLVRLFPAVVGVAVCALLIVVAMILQVAI